MIQFKHTAHIATVHRLPVDMVTLIEVVGDPDHASYEWVISHAGVIQSHSDDGYGSIEAALRDALIAYLGLPMAVAHQIAELQAEVAQLAADRANLLSTVIAWAVTDAPSSGLLSLQTELQGALAEIDTALDVDDALDVIRPQPAARQAMPGREHGLAALHLLAWLAGLVVCVLMTLLFSSTAHAADIGLHTVTWHDLERQSNGELYHTRTPGVYLRGDAGWTVGALSNSIGRLGAYAGWTWSTDTRQPVSVALTAGGITGYQDRPVRPMLIPSLRIGTAEAGLRLAVLPKGTPNSATAITVSIEVSAP